jgi:hypothetical protein
MVWGIVAKAAGMAAARLAPKIATKIPRAVPAMTRAVAKVAAPVVAPLKKVAAKAVTTVTARIPTRAAATAGLARVGITLPTKRVLPVAARPTTALKAAVSKAAVGLVEKPFRTVLPYAATAGMIGAVSKLGEKKTEAVVRKGAMVGTALTTVPQLPIGGRRMAYPATVGQVPLAEPTIVRSWTTGTTEFIVDSTGQHWVLTRSGWKKYTPKKPIVLGTKHLTPKKFIQAAKKYYGLKKDLDKVFKTVKKRK